jgi:dTDP-4-amino-4,6-dideoxygalactose transaminase
MNAYRRELAEYFTYKLAGIPSILAPKTCDGGVHTYYTYGVRYTGGNRNELQKRLNEAGVYFGNPDYGKPLYLLPGYKHLGLGMGTCPVAERLWAGELMVTDRLRYPTTFRDIDRWTEIIKRTIGSG